MSENILLVDDREENLLSLESILEPAGYHFVRATSGKDALKALLKQIDFALILMDVRMPGLDGFETASLIYERERLRHIPIIFITAIDSGDENIFNGYRAGAVDFIHKPVNPALLRAKVSVFVDLYRKNEKLRMQEKRLTVINNSLELEVKERKASEEKVMELNRQLVQNIGQLEAANKDLDNFVFMASHDMQEPLRKIKTFCNLLKGNYQEQLDEAASAYIGKIHSSAERMQRLIADILNFSRISQEEFTFQETDLNKLLRDVLGDLSDKLQLRKVSIELKELPTVPVNAVLMRSLFYNLIHNAIKYSRKEVTPVIKVFARQNPGFGSNRNGNGGYCSIIVEDNGIGFEQQYAEQIFDIFKRLHGNAEFSGTGIGLALCKKIVEKHRGYISALSRPDEGAVFVVTLPLNQEPANSNNKQGKSTVKQHS